MMGFRGLKYGIAIAIVTAGSITNLYHLAPGRDVSKVWRFDKRNI